MTADNRERECAHPLAGLAQVGDQREQCRHPEDHRKEVCELAKKPHGNRHARRTFDPIRAEFGETSSSLGRRPAAVVLRLSKAASTPS